MPVETMVYKRNFVTLLMTIRDSYKPCYYLPLIYLKTSIDITTCYPSYTKGGYTLNIATNHILREVITLVISYRPYTAGSYETCCTAGGRFVPEGITSPV